jgi:hypothetical protein
LAGSIVSTATFFPREAIPAAIAAEIVVLPTPPEPAQMHTSLPRSVWATPEVLTTTLQFALGPASKFPTRSHLCRASRSHDLRGEPLDPGHPELGLEHERQRPNGGGYPLP